MSLYKRIIAMLLALSMLLFLVACGGGGKDESSAGSSDDDISAEASSEDEDSAEELYRAAAEALLQKADIKQSVTSVTKRTVGTNVLSLEKESTAVYRDGGKAVYIADKTVNGTDMWRSDKYYGNGKYMYSPYGTEELYYKEMSAEDFAALQIPLVLLTADLYGTVSFDGEDEGAFVLTDATAIEAWLAPEYATVSTAEGKAKLNNSGEIEQFSYTAEYTQGPASYQVEYTVKLSAPDANDTVTLPEGDGTQFDHIELFDIFETAYAATTALIAFEYNSSRYIYSQAGGVGYNSSEQSYSYGTDSKDFIAKAKFEDEIYYYDGTEETSTIEQKYKNGKLTTYANGEESTTSFAMKRVLDSIKENDDIISLTKPNIANFESVEVNDLYEYWQISYKLNQAGNENLEDYVSLLFFNDADTVDNAASAYSADLADGYICIDKDTMLITAVGMDFAGTHTIDGYQYTTGIKATVSYSVASAATYKEITDELPEAAEPESKPTPLFYKVTAPDGGVMYMLGTIHIGDVATSYLPKEIYEALENADALAVEFDLLAFEEQFETDSELKQAVAETYYYPDGSLISDHIEEELYKAGMQHILTAGMPTYAADYLTPSAWGDAIADLYRKSYPVLSSEYGVDKQLLRFAKEKGIEILDVESAEDQYGMVYQYTDDIHRILLIDALSGTRAQYIASTQELYDIWCAGDESALMKHIRDNELPEDATEEELKAIEQYNNILGANRDAKMVEKAKQYMESGKTVFFAVGEAHVLAETGLVEMLRADGYTVERVQYGG